MTGFISGFASYVEIGWVTPFEVAQFVLGFVILVVWATLSLSSYRTRNAQRFSGAGAMLAFAALPFFGAAMSVSFNAANHTALIQMRLISLEVFSQSEHQFDSSFQLLQSNLLEIQNLISGFESFVTSVQLSFVFLGSMQWAFGQELIVKLDSRD